MAVPRKRKKTRINYRFIDLKHIDPCSWRRKKFDTGFQEYSTRLSSYVLSVLNYGKESVCPLALIRVDTS